MAIIIPDDKIRNVKLTGDEITWIIEALESSPHNIFEFLNYKDIIKKLKGARDKK